jgi:hypothetical protein
MKKVVFTLTLLSIVMLSFGQSFDLGIKGGFNSTKITTNSSLSDLQDYTFDDFTSDLSGGYDIGAFARIGGKRIYLQPELLYSLKNGETQIQLSPDEGGNPVTVNQEINLKAIQIPLLVGIKLVNLKLASIRAFTGPAMSIVLDGSESSLDQDISEGFQPDQLENNIWDWQLGGGVDIGSFTFDVRYAWGITNITEDDYSFENKGNTLTFSVGLKLF